MRLISRGSLEKSLKFFATVRRFAGVAMVVGVALAVVEVVVDLGAGSQWGLVFLGVDIVEDTCW